MNSSPGKYNNKYRIASTRLKGWDYSASGWYFVTICTDARSPFFGDIQDGDMRRSPLGEVAHHCWLEIPNHFPLAALDEFIIMPDHVHGIIVITPTDTTIVETHFVETQHAASLRHPHNQFPNDPKPLPNPGSISAVVRSYKSAVSHWARENGCTEFRWQARFYDHIIRDEASLEYIRLYIFENPQKWGMDE